MCVRVGTAAPAPSGFRDAPATGWNVNVLFPRQRTFLPSYWGWSSVGWEKGTFMLGRYVDVGPGAPAATPPRPVEADASGHEPIATTSEAVLHRRDGRTSRAVPPRGGPAGACGCRGGGCCTFARAPRLRKPRNHAEEWFQRRPGSGSHVRRPPSAHMGARQPRTTIDGKACNSAENMPSLRTGPALPCATPEKAASRPRCCTDTPQSRAGIRPISATWDARAAAGCRHRG